MVQNFLVNFDVTRGQFSSNNLIVKDAFTWEHFDFPYWRIWMSTNFHVPIICVFTYMCTIFLGKRWMKNREAFCLKPLLVSWNIGFATFSLLAFYRTYPYLSNVVWEENNWADGFYKSVCSSENLTVQFAFWSWIGVISKVAELGDTMFIIFRKQRLIFLHWYHHSTTLLYTWYIFPAQEPCHRWLMTMNFFVHILMYSYYASKAGGIRVPRFFAIVLTSLQIFQMVVGIFVNWYTWRELDAPRGCERYRFNLIVAAVMYISYLVLFANFFYQTYFKGSKKKQA